MKAPQQRQPKSLFSRYINRVKEWSLAGYRFSYSQSAVAVGHMGFGFLAPFNLLLERYNGSDKTLYQKQSPENQFEVNPLLHKKNEEHQSLKENSAAYRGLHRYVKTLSRLNEDFVMRPIANVFALAGGLIGLVVGLPISLFGFTPSKLADVTKENQYFSTININPETRNFFGVMVWGGIAGYLFGNFYAAPITILGNTFQGASAFSGLFSGVATFIYQLPTLLNNTWELTKKLVTNLRDLVIWSGKKLQTGFNWLKEQFNFVLGKISKVLTVIKENGIRGLVAFIKEKTIGAVIRYFDNLSAVRAAKNEIRGVVHVLLNDAQKTKTLFQLIGKQEIDIVPNKTDNLGLVMAHIEQIAEAHRSNYQHGSIQVKLNYLETLKLSLDDLKVANFEDNNELSPDLEKLLDSNYRSWQSAEKEMDKAPEQVDFLGEPSKTHLPQHKAVLAQAQQQGASNDDASLDDELKSKKGRGLPYSK